MPKEMNRQEMLAASGVVRVFLQDPTIKLMFEAMRERYYDDFIAANTEPERLEAWAKSRVLAEFSTNAVAVMDAGTRIRDEIRAEEKRTSSPAV